MVLLGPEYLGDQEAPEGRLQSDSHLNNKHEYLSHSGTKSNLKHPELDSLYRRVILLLSKSCYGPALAGPAQV